MLEARWRIVTQVGQAFAAFLPVLFYEINRAMPKAAAAARPPMSAV